MDADRTDHYTVVVEIHRVMKPQSTVNTTRGQDTLLGSGSKEKVEVARVVIRDDTIDGLITKTQAHLDLIKD